MMSTEQEQHLVEQIGSLFQKVLILTSPPSLPERYASSPSVRSLYADLVLLRKILHLLSRGDLSQKIPLPGYLGGTLKTLQANLKHIAWQTKMVARGDFSQRVDFLGEFSESFNAMVVQLDQTLQELLSKQLSEANAQLLKEISVRKRTEEDLLQSREELKRLAQTDPLTGLYNRRHFTQAAVDQIDRAIRYSRPLSIMMFDIDHFKQINDTFGHSTGDKVLQQIARTSVDIFRATDMLARYGGEEFIALLYETSALEAANVAERLRCRIENSNIQAQNGPVTLTASFGVSDCFGHRDAKPGEEVLAEFVSTADAALYLSKRMGRNRVTIFRPSARPSGVA